MPLIPFEHSSLMRSLGRFSKIRKKYPQWKNSIFCDIFPRWIKRDQMRYGNKTANGLEVPMRSFGFQHDLYEDRSL